MSLYKIVTGDLYKKIRTLNKKYVQSIQETISNMDKMSSEVFLQNYYGGKKIHCGSKKHTIRKE
jgi:hypothetical protein